MNEAIWLDGLSLAPNPPKPPGPPSGFRMNAASPIALTKSNNDAARRRLGSVKGEPLLLADWERALFIHYEVEAEVLQAEIPFPLDRTSGWAARTV